MTFWAKYGKDKDVEKLGKQKQHVEFEGYELNISTQLLISSWLQQVLYLGEREYLGLFMFSTFQSQM